MGYLYQHNLFHSLVVQRDQHILDILDDPVHDQEAQRSEAELRDEDDKQEQQAKSEVPRLSQGMNSLFNSLISFKSDGGPPSARSKAVDVESLKLQDQSQFLSPFARRMRQNEILLATQYRDLYVAFLK